METTENFPQVTGLVVREASLSDAADIAALLGELGYPTTLEQARGRLARLDLSADCVLAAIMPLEVVGFVSVHLLPMVHEDGSLGRITALVVKEKFRNQQVGTKLLTAAEAFARQAGCTRLELTSADYRTEAHRFYLRKGFQIHSRRFLKLLS